MGPKLLSPKIENTYWAKSKMALASLLFTSHILFLSQKISVLLSWPRGVLTFLTSNKAAAPLFDIFFIFHSSRHIWLPMVPSGMWLSEYLRSSSYNIPPPFLSLPPVIDRVKALILKLRNISWASFDDWTKKGLIPEVISRVSWTCFSS